MNFCEIRVAPKLRIRESKVQPKPQGGIMLWRGGRQSDNIEDRRGVHPAVVGGGLGGIILLLIALYFGVDPREIFNQNSTVEANNPAATSPADQETKDFVSTVLAYTEDTWTDIFQRAGKTYREPKLVLFNGSVESACGFAQAAMGPFYCPEDEKVYLDTSFFQDLRDRFQAPGDFARAYVIAHEIGHHVQNLLGISSQVQALQQGQGKAAANRASVRLELQADCLAGVWANHTERMQQTQMKEFLESGDVDQALEAASQIGDDRLQMQSRGYIVPESFTHGTAAQRSHWFKQGFENGNVSGCNTFAPGAP
jgi:predicted metalloprotease